MKDIISEVPSFFKRKQGHLQGVMGNDCRPVQWEGAWRGCCGSEMQTQKESSQRHCRVAVEPENMELESHVCEKANCGRQYGEPRDIRREWKMRRKRS